MLDRAQALKVLDRLVDEGYVACLRAVPQRDGYAIPNHEGPVYSVFIEELGIDKVDLKALVKIADELEVDVGAHGLTKGLVNFSALSTEPEAIRSPRKHPRNTA